MGHFGSRIEEDHREICELPFLHNGLYSFQSASYPFPTGAALSIPAQVTPQPTSNSYSAPQMPGPLPLQDSSYHNNSSVISSGSVPTLVSHTSSDSSNFNGENSHSYSAMPETPQEPSTIPTIEDSPSHYRSMSNPSHSNSSEKYSSHDYVNFDNGEAYTQPGSGYWAEDSNVAGSYGMGGNVLYDQPPQLPHVHESHSRQPSSNDLRVVYPALAQ